MSKCVKTGINIQLGADGPTFHTDAHLCGAALIFTSIDEAHRVYTLPPDLLIRDTSYFLSGGKHPLLVADARKCELLSADLALQWAQYDPEMLGLVISAIAY